MRSWVDIIVKISQGLNQWGSKQTYAFQVVNSKLSPPLILRLLGLDIGPNNVMFWKAPMLPCSAVFSFTSMELDHLQPPIRMWLWKMRRRRMRKMRCCMTLGFPHLWWPYVCVFCAKKTQPSDGFNRLLMYDKLKDLYEVDYLKILHYKPDAISMYHLYTFL